MKIVWTNKVEGHQISRYHCNVRNEYQKRLLHKKNKYSTVIALLDDNVFILILLKKQ